MMRRMVMVAICSLMFATSGFAQFQRSLFNHVGLNAGVGTEGINIGVAAPLSNFFEVEAGVSILPSILKIDTEVDLAVDESVNIQGQQVSIPNEMNVKADFSRTAVNVKANVYPFGGNSKFFVSGGFSFGGAKIAKLSGHSDELQNLINQYPAYKQTILDHVSVNLDDYNIKLDENCDVHGDIRCNNFRPYLGLGFGRLVPKNRLGFRWELGCQFMGSLKVYQNGEEVDVKQALNDSMGKDADDISQFIDNWKFYPVLTLPIVGRIL